MLKHRIITAAILIPIVVTSIFWPATSGFVLLFSLITVFGAWEWSTLCHASKQVRILYTASISFILASLFYLNTKEIYLVTLVVGCIYWLLAVFLVCFYQQQRNYLPKSTSLLLIVGVLLLIPMWSSAMLLKLFHADGAVLLMFLMLLVWSADTAAYFVGKKWGKHKLAPRVSPGKTWEGTVAGVLAGIVLSFCYVIVSNGELNNKVGFIMLSTLAVILSVFGDLMESLVKREADIKDSGNILPGHGGIMDRIDSLTAAGPIYVLGLFYFGVSL